MQEKAKSNSIITHRIIDGKVEFTVKGEQPFIVDPDKLSAQNRARAMIHGIIQRISDGGALSRNPENGQPATPADKRARMVRIADHLMSGTTEWALKAVVGEGVNVGLVIRAMIAMGKARDVDHANELIGKLAAKHGVERDAAVKMLADAGDIKAKMLELRAAEVKVTKTADDLLADLMDEEQADDEAPM